MSPKFANTRRELFKLKMDNPMYYTRSTSSPGGECPFCGCSNGDHDEDCELDE